MVENNESFLETKFEELIGEYDGHRKAIKDMIVDLERLKLKIDTLIPDKLDARYMRYFEEKIKAVTSLFNSLLDMRKEIAKSIKDEIEIRRKVEGKDEIFDLENMIDVRSMVNTLDKFNNQTSVLKQHRINKKKNEVIQDDIEIPGITTKIKETRSRWLIMKRKIKF